MADKVCSFDGCGPTRGRVVRGLCGAHYAQLRAGRVLTAVVKWGVSGVAVCGFDGCAETAVAAATRLCGGHERQRRRGLALSPLDLRDAVRTPYRRDSYLARVYNMREEDYAELLRSQGGVCAVCRRSEPSGRRLSVDHDHACCPTAARSCGRCIRGLLCSSCNTAAGSMDDDPDRIRALASYLDDHAARSTSAAA